jgi:hypothetical protein
MLVALEIRALEGLGGRDDSLGRAADRRDVRIRPAGFGAKYPKQRAGRHQFGERLESGANQLPQRRDRGPRLRRHGRHHLSPAL